MKFSKETIKGAADVIVLAALQEAGEAYGYQLLSAISTNSDNIFEFQEGTLYPLLYRMEDKGWIESEKKKADSGKERRYYRLTDAGANTLKLRAKEYATFMKGMTRVLESVQ